VKGDKGTAGTDLLIAVIVKLLMTYPRQHLRQNLSRKDRMFGIRDFSACLFFSRVAIEAFCLVELAHRHRHIRNDDGNKTNRKLRKGLFQDTRDKAACRGSKWVDRTEGREGDTSRGTR